MLEIKEKCMQDPLPIDSNNPCCVNTVYYGEDKSEWDQCVGLLECRGAHLGESEQYDVFVCCLCNQGYKHIYNGDIWRYLD